MSPNDRAIQHQLDELGILALADLASEAPPLPKYAFGLREIDVAIGGGLCPGLFNAVVGYAQNGKTALLLRLICNNPTIRIFLASDDERGSTLINKLIAYRTGMTTLDVARHHPEWKSAKAVEYFPNLFIRASNSKMGFGPEDLEAALLTFTDVWEAPVDLVVLDYLGKIRTEFGEELSQVQEQAEFCKTYAMENPETVFAVGHQANRSALGTCKALGFEHVAYGSEQQVDGVMIGCRKRSLAERSLLLKSEGGRDLLERYLTAPTINVSVMKNKITQGSTPGAGHEYGLRNNGWIYNGRRKDRLPDDHEGVEDGDESIPDRDAAA